MGHEVRRGLPGLAPSQAVQLDHLESVTVTLGSWPEFATATHGQIEVDWNGAGGVDDDGMLFTLMVVNPPGAAPRPLTDALSVTVDAEEVYTTGQTSPNVVRMRSINQLRSPLAAKPGTPVFTLMLTCGDTPTAQTLTTRSLALGTGVVPAPGYEQQWKADLIDDRSRRRAGGCIRKRPRSLGRPPGSSSRSHRSSSRRRTAGD